MNRDPRDGVAEMTLGVGDFDYDFEGCSRAVPGPVGGYGPREEARALDTLQGAIEGVDAAQNADAAMEATRQPIYAWRLCWETPTFGAIATEPIDWTGGANPTDRLVTEARALASCLRHPVDIQYRRDGRWALWDIARPIATCRGGAA